MEHLAAPTEPYQSLVPGAYNTIQRRLQSEISGRGVPLPVALIDTSYIADVAPVNEGASTSPILEAARTALQGGCKAVVIDIALVELTGDQSGIDEPRKNAAMALVKQFSALAKQFPAQTIVMSWDAKSGLPSDQLPGNVRYGLVNFPNASLDHHLSTRFPISATWQTTLGDKFSVPVLFSQLGPLKEPKAGPGLEGDEERTVKGAGSLSQLWQFRLLNFGAAPQLARDSRSIADVATLDLHDKIVVFGDLQRHQDADTSNVPGMAREAGSLQTASAIYSALFDPLAEVGHTAAAAYTFLYAFLLLGARKALEAPAAWMLKHLPGIRGRGTEKKVAEWILVVAAIVFSYWLFTAGLTHLRIVYQGFLASVAFQLVEVLLDQGKHSLTETPHETPH